jgi:small subunit ribosomal protein S13
MAETKPTTPVKKEEKKQKPKVEKEKKIPEKEEYHESLTRILGYDIPGNKSVFIGLTRIKGVSWAISNALCLKTGIDRKKKISELSKDEIVMIEKFIMNPDVPDYMKNRRLDRETGKTTHLYGTDLDIARDFDIKRLKKIKAYKGIRHAAGQPVRGQRTKSHFRRNKIVAIGGKKK